MKININGSAVGRLLHRLGLSPQRPLWRAWQADPDKVAAWWQAEYPAIAAAAKKAGGTVYFADEAGIRSDHHAGRTWGRVGHTPVVKTTTGARHSLNMISAVTAQGKLRFATFTGGFDAGKFIEFAKKLLHDTDRPVFLVVDGHPAHKAKKVKTFVEQTTGRLRLSVLPGYSPQLNPDEWVWKNVKAGRVGRAGITGPDQFRALAIGALRRLQAMPHIVRGFFADPEPGLHHGRLIRPTNPLFSRYRFVDDRQVQRDRGSVRRAEQRFGGHTSQHRTQDQCKRWRARVLVPRVEVTRRDRSAVALDSRPAGRSEWANERTNERSFGGESGAG